MGRKPHDRRTTEILTDALTAQDGERIALGTLMAPLQRRAFGFLLLLLAIPNFIPVPLGVGGVMGVLVVALGLQMLAGLERPWLPGWLARRMLPRAALLRFLARIAPFTRWLERLCQPRLERLTVRPLTIASGLVMVLLGLLLALPIPFTNYLFGGLLLAFAFALIERDGALLLGVWAITLTCVALSATFSHALAGQWRELF
ncbi:exopolysaccharide biosynthesis protein [Frateuria defendens]|uniref:exopolysaccharide biosynthesis protein n=1 Tax=Frateuria defendens TaxID=2219559 RepID=UPI00069F25EE|nr:exopolysaccharide biosynthesis protein [Frateuria defendens]